MVLSSGFDVDVSQILPPTEFGPSTPLSHPYPGQFSFEANLLHLLYQIGLLFKGVGNKLSCKIVAQTFGNLLGYFHYQFNAKTAVS